MHYIKLRPNMHMHQDDLHAYCDIIPLDITVTSYSIIIVGHDQMLEYSNVHSFM